MKKNYFFTKRLSEFTTTKRTFVVFILLNICSSFFHLYFSKEISLKNEIHSKGEVITYAEKDVENTSTSNDSLNIIHIEGDVIIYNSLKEEVIDEQPKIVRTTKKETVVKVHKTSIKKTYIKNKVNAYFTDFNSNFLVTSLLIKNDLSVVTPQNSNSKYAINDSVNTKKNQQVYQEHKVNDHYFSKEIPNSFSKKFFGRPPPFLI